MGLFATRAPQVPELAAMDTVVPVPTMDDQMYGRNCCVHYTYQFNDVLDKDKLQRSLQRLMEIGGWRKLGARVRLNRHGKLDYLIPARYTEERPGFIFTTAAHPIKIHEHPLSSHLPKFTGNPSLFGPTGRVSALCLHPDCPQKLDDWLYSDRPQLNIHVVVFLDATLLTVTFMHLLMDGMSLGLFLRAWTAVMSGHEEQVPVFRGIDEDLLRPDTMTVPASEYIHHDRWLRGVKLVIFVICMLWNMLWSRRAEPRHFCIPGNIITAMRSQVIEELEKVVPKEMQPIFLSESDVLLAWCTRTIVRGLGTSPRRAITLLNMFDVRSHLLHASASDKTAFITNATLASSTHLRANEIAHRPLSFLAWQIRVSLIQQRTKSQCQAQYATAKTGSQALFGRPTSILVACSNWHKARFYDIDFSSALIRSRDPAADRWNSPGRPFNIISTTSGGMPERNTGRIYGKDASEIWWLCWTLTEEAWAIVRLELDKLEKLGQEAGFSAP